MTNKNSIKNKLVNSIRKTKASILADNDSMSTQSAAPKKVASSNDASSIKKPAPKRVKTAQNKTTTLISRGCRVWPD